MVKGIGESEMEEKGSHGYGSQRSCNGLKEVPWTVTQCIT